MKLKVCGMEHNTGAVAALQPDYLGFIFWEPSKRAFSGSMPALPRDIQKVGVFVDAELPEVLAAVDQFQLELVQLHGKESPEFCKALGQERPVLQIIKVFSIRNNFDFGQLHPYEDVCHYFLFDSKGELPGGNGYTFNWKVLQAYPSQKPYFLSGGIGMEQLEELQAFFNSPAAQYCHAVDVNSSFELAPGKKDTKALEDFKQALQMVGH